MLSVARFIGSWSVMLIDTEYQSCENNETIETDYDETAKGEGIRYRYSKSKNQMIFYVRSMST